MSSDPDLAEIVSAVHDDIAAEIGSGRVAAYIPALACVDPRQFALVVTTLDGKTTSIGDDETAFSIQSISKVFTLTLVLGRIGETLWERVGREPSGSAFNSIVQLEQEKGHPRNPLINPGAIVVTDELLRGRRPAVVFTELGDFMRRLACDERVGMDEDVAASEAEMGFRNVSLANYLKAFGNLRNPIDDVLDVYFHQCALSMTVRQLSRAGLYLANGGTDPLTSEQVIDEPRARRINAIMMTCGHYDASGDFAFRVGLPGKSGVGGGILVIAPRRAAIAVWSPGLNENGNSLVGTLALERLAQRTGWSVF